MTFQSQFPIQYQRTNPRTIFQSLMHVYLCTKPQHPLHFTSLRKLILPNRIQFPPTLHTHSLAYHFLHFLCVRILCGKRENMLYVYTLFTIIFNIFHSTTALPRYCHDVVIFKNEKKSSALSVATKIKCIKHANLV